MQAITQRDRSGLPAGVAGKRVVQSQFRVEPDQFPLIEIAVIGGELPSAPPRILEFGGGADRREHVARSEVNPRPVQEGFVGAVDRAADIIVAVLEAQAIVQTQIVGTDPLDIGRHVGVASRAVTPGLAVVTGLSREHPRALGDQGEAEPTHEGERVHSFI